RARQRAGFVVTVVAAPEVVELSERFGVVATGLELNGLSNGARDHGLDLFERGLRRVRFDAAELSAVERDAGDIVFRRQVNRAGREVDRESDDAGDEKENQSQAVE